MRALSVPLLASPPLPVLLVPRPPPLAAGLLLAPAHDRQFHSATIQCSAIDNTEWRVTWPGTGLNRPHAAELLINPVHHGTAPLTTKQNILIVFNFTYGASQVLKCKI